ncbi:DotU family type IV/VI secretion system protein [Stieleria sp. TO1_6]|uniref:DotU family type IV/VI secretion system protein n=1 Tax=Stieleria tagensis TaxID=2956795 RepID=UPI00209AB982|nr:DotU family type IV/VI secretion system protein [Stieleria tagensis]MCO8121103.1 DotU family type IV/VI secretion system protein [Stieleria tagensis]
MSPEFASAVDPIFMYVSSIVDAIEANKNPAAEDVNTTVRGLIDSAETRLGQRPDWELAKYALAAWVDDLLIEAAWDGSSWWEQNRLEFQLFRTADAFQKFYVQSQKAMELPQKDALEVFYVCIVLGFRGLYGDPEATAHADHFGLPASLDEWARRTGMAIQLGQGRPPILEQGRPGPGAPPLEGKYLMISSVICFVLLAAITIGIAKMVLMP